MISAFVLLLFIILSTFRKKIDSSCPLSFFKDLFSSPFFDKFKNILDTKYDRKQIYNKFRELLDKTITTL